MPAELPRLAITGSTGVVGGMVARSLAVAGVPQRLLVRDLSRAPDLPKAVPFAVSYGDRAAAVEALTGVDLLLMVSASESADRLDQHRAFIDSAVQAGVSQIVYTSFFRAAPDAVFTLARDHYATEEYIKASGLAYTFLRDCLYLDFLPAMVGEDGVLRGPAGNGTAAVVSRSDVARVATMVLARPEEHLNATYNLTGREALSMSAIAGILTESTGRQVSYYDETVEEAYASRKKWPAPDWQYDAWVSTYTAIAAGQMGPVSDDIERITGTPPLTLAEFLAESPPAG